MLTFLIGSSISQTLCPYILKTSSFSPLRFLPLTVHLLFTMKCKMLLPNVLAVFVGLAGALLIPNSQELGDSIVRRQSYPYPANTIDMPVGSKYSPQSPHLFKFSRLIIIQTSLATHHMLVVRLSKDTTSPPPTTSLVVRYTSISLEKLQLRIGSQISRLEVRIAALLEFHMLNIKSSK